MDEIWKPIVGWEGFYEVSNIGRVRGLDRVSRGVRVKGRIRKLAKSRKQYPYWQAHLSRDGREGKMHRLFVHQLVLEAFVGPRPEGMVACHNNGDHLDNRVENLRWATPSDNQKDSFRHGTHHWLRHHERRRQETARR